MLASIFLYEKDQLNRSAFLTFPQFHSTLTKYDPKNKSKLINFQIRSRAIFPAQSSAILDQLITQQMPKSNRNYDNIEIQSSVSVWTRAFKSGFTNRKARFCAAYVNSCETWQRGRAATLPSLHRPRGWQSRATSKLKMSGKFSDAKAQEKIRISEFIALNVFHYSKTDLTSWTKESG